MDEQSGSDPRPLVSIVIPTYNRADLLPACIDSALSQDYPSFEVIVVDDGSTDETREVCASYRDRVRYFHKRNGGAASALNHGIGRMRGEWFKWLSSDDLLEPKGLASLVDAATDQRIGVVYGDFTEIDLLGRPKRRISFMEARSHAEFVVRLWSRFTASAGSAMIRKSCFDAVGLFDETLRYCEDYDWWLRATMLYSVRFRHVPALIFRYRVHEGQAMRTLPGGGTVEDMIRSRMTRLLTARYGSDGKVYADQLETTRRFRRIFGPAVMASWLFERAPRRTLLKALKNELLFRLVPEASAELFWAVNPPLIPRGSDCSLIDRVRLDEIRASEAGRMGQAPS